MVMLSPWKCYRTVVLCDQRKRAPESSRVRHIPQSPQGRCLPTITNAAVRVCAATAATASCSVTDRANALVFGGFGALGTAIARRLTAAGHEVSRTSRSRTADADGLWVEPFASNEAGLSALDQLSPLHAVAWAQGANRADSVEEFDLASFEEVLRANCTFVAATMAALVQRDLLADGARLCVVSSIWETVARQQKFSYTVSKAAVGGLVRSAAVDLASRGILVNAVLPGVVDTPMTTTMLTPEQLQGVIGATRFDRLVSVEDVAAIVCHLCSSANTGVTGQSIAVDLGFSMGRRV